jgi:hypothetical protein
MQNLFDNPWKDDSYYREQWLAYYEERNHRIIRLGYSLSGIACAGLLFALIPQRIQEHHPIFSVTVGIASLVAWLLIVIQWFMLNWQMGNWNCPRCAEPFFISSFVRNPFGRKCRHCGLRRLKQSEVKRRSPE